MQAKSILMVLSAMALVTACANDETIEINYGESISLSAVAGKTTRTGSEATTTNSIRNFHVLAFTHVRSWQHSFLTAPHNPFWHRAPASHYLYPRSGVKTS